MTIKIKEIKKSEKKEKIDYPCLMENKRGSTVILMIESGSGIILKSEGGRHNFEYRRNYWNMDHFSPLPEGEGFELVNTSIRRNNND